MVREHTLYDLNLFRIIDSFTLQHVVLVAIVQRGVEWNIFLCILCSVFYKFNQVKLVDSVVQCPISLLNLYLLVLLIFDTDIKISDYNYGFVYVFIQFLQ